MQCLSRVLIVYARLQSVSLRGTLLHVCVLLAFAEGVVQAKVHEVKQGDDLNAAISKAQLGDQLVLEAGAEFPGPIILLNKTQEVAEGQSPWITIRTSKLAELPPVGQRVTPQDAVHMPKIYTDTSYPAVTAAFGAHHYHFVGIEISSRTEKSYDLVRFGYNKKNGIEHATSLEELPFKIVFERCYIHGNKTGELRTGITMNTREFAIFDSHISEIHEDGADAQALIGFNGTGPYKIVNNFIEASGENVLFGGADPRIDQLVPADILIERNYFFKPLHWKKGHPNYQKWTVKNLLEFKSAKRAMVRGNLFENCWPAGQTGKAILLTARNQDGKAPWSTVEDITFENNILRNVNGFLQMGSADGIFIFPTQNLKNIIIRNNLMLNVAEDNSRGVRSFFEIDGSDNRLATQNVKIVHNVGLFVSGHGKSLMMLGDSGTVIDGLVFEKNIFSCGRYGVAGAGSQPGTVSLNRYLRNWTFRDNILIGAMNPEGYPPENVIVPKATDVGFVDPATGDFRLSSTSPGQKRLGSDDTPPGINLELLKAWTEGVVEGRLPEKSE